MGYCLVFLLAGCVPDHQFYFSAVDFELFDDGLAADGGLEFAELVGCVARDDVGFADAGVADDDGFDHEVSLHELWN